MGLEMKWNRQSTPSQGVITCCGQSEGRHTLLFGQGRHVPHQQKHLVVLLNPDTLTGPKNI